MADGEFTLKLDEETARRLRETAKARGVTPEALGAQILTDDLLLSPNDFDLPGIEDAELPGVEEDLLDIEEFDRTRMGVPWEEIRDWMNTWGKPERMPPPKVRKL
ncbi:MAG: hypothetical protein Q7T61_01675 [Caulobacter sp.]|nr:hypothetical protein [Caulobacter sp.]